MARPWKLPSTNTYYIRQRIPRDVLHKARGHTLTFPKEAGGGAVRITNAAEMVKASLRTREPVVAKERFSAALAYLERYWQALRAGPKHLTQKQIVALGGLAYRWFNKAEDDPGPASLWAKALRFVQEMNEGKHGLRELMIDPTPDEVRDSALKFNVGPIADGFLAAQALVVDEESRWRIIQEIHRVLVQVFEKLKRNAEGDYRPDPMADRFPAWQNEPTKPLVAVTVSGLFEGWSKEAKAKQLSDKTIKEYGSIINRLIAFLGHDDANRVSEYDLIRWKDHRIAQGRSLKTIGHSDFACFKAVFGWGRDNRRIPTNPAKEIHVKPGRKVRERAEQGFTLAEAKQILTASLHYTPTERELAETSSAKRWVPWLCAYTGARVGEMIQLRKQDIERKEGAWVATITSEAGRVKGKAARVVVLHPHLIKLGFIDFVKAAKGPYLFMNARNKDEALGRISGTKNRLREFVRTIVKDKRVQPNHGWRHRFITVAREAGIASDVIYAITGHAAPNVGGAYGNVTIKAQAKALARYPSYIVNR